MEQQSIDAAERSLLDAIAAGELQSISPRYLAGLYGTVVDVDHAAATIDLERPAGRFANGRVRIPPLALDKLSPVA